MGEITDSIILRNLVSKRFNSGNAVLHIFDISLTSCGRLDLLKLKSSNDLAKATIYLCDIHIDAEPDLTPDADTMEIISFGKLTKKGNIWELDKDSRCVLNARTTNKGTHGLSIVVTGVVEPERPERPEEPEHLTGPEEEYHLVIDLIHITYTKV
jgi:hypothetical protein